MLLSNQPSYSIVAVHGLNGHRGKTWTAKMEFTGFVIFSLTIFPEPVSSAGATMQTRMLSLVFLYDHARTLVSDLNRKRKLTNSSQRPIIFIAHSLGGIVLKSALIHSDAARQGALLEQQSVKLSTYGILFMGTPHQGGNGVQLGRILANIVSVFVAANDCILKHLERDSEWLLQQLGQYGPISSDRDEICNSGWYIPLPLLGNLVAEPRQVVPRASAVVPGQADAESILIHADHKNMVKFLSKQDVGYTTV
ncbi:unnamed protein product [Clonostachys solani]|uniref:DUF676 domain-containing protein n=1 Tax=Clonostachys solani TaxID=160281 RepID=A0A9P0EP54_9HYPO|nr:unnamed protein product [Clonostachys solani]